MGAEEKLKHLVIRSEDCFRRYTENYKDCFRQDTGNYNTHTVFILSSTFWGSRALHISQCQCRCPLWIARSHRMGLYPDEHKEMGIKITDPLFANVSCGEKNDPGLLLTES